MEDPASMNHHFWGDISAWFIKHLAGICYNPAGNDWQRVDICPQFPAELEDAKGWFDSNYGKITASWQREGEKIRLSLQIPEGFRGTVKLPAGWTLENGSSQAPAVTGTYLLHG